MITYLGKPSLRERATDQRGIVHHVTDLGSLLTTACGVPGRWEDKNFSTNYAPMVWDGFDPKPDITCMACLVREARR